MFHTEVALNFSLLVILIGKVVNILSLSIVIGHFNLINNKMDTH